MKKRTKKIFLFSAGALVLLTGSFLVYGIYSFMTSPLFGEALDDQPDDVLITNFHMHRAEFEQLREMSTEDATMTRVDDNWTNPATLNSDRVAEYRRLFKVIGTPRGIIADLNRDRIEFISTSHGWFSSGSFKGYLYLKERPNLKERPIKLVDNLDSYGWHTEMDTFVIRHIEGNWYLFFQRI
jgi:hypothetical protein